MACDCISNIQILIDAERKYLANCRWIYGIVLVVSIGLAASLRFYVWKDSPLNSLSALLANGLVFPIVPKHLLTSRRVAFMEGLQ